MSKNPGQILFGRDFLLRLCNNVHPTFAQIFSILAQFTRQFLAQFSPQILQIFFIFPREIFWGD